MKNNFDYIVQILRLQDKVTKKHLKDHLDISKRYQFCIDCLNWSWNFLNRKGLANNEIVLHNLFINCFSSILVSSNIVLWGTVTDSLNILRPALEFLAIADYVIDKNEYALLKKELSKSKFKKLDFKCLKSCGFLDKKLIKEWRSISDIASHGSTSRLRNNNFRMNGKTYPRFGVAYDPRGVRQVLGNIANVSLYLTRVQVKILDKEDKLSSHQRKLEDTYKKLVAATKNYGPGNFGKI